MILDKFSNTAKYVVGIFVSSILFALFHPGIYLFSFAFLSGIAYSLIYLKTNSIILPISLHQINNIGSFITIKTENIYLGFLIKIISTILLLSVIVCKKKKNRK